MTPELKWACTSFGTCAASLMTWAVPVLQTVLLVVSIYAALRALRKK